ncbi:MAG: orotidine-5'-phosphate decarboxylase [Burkholderiales bacterium]|jgi:orotidine-5'-phosphate decarboxylase|nr:orotidine-5'-phosphate decarboxylase [Burkholderiales bacterium]
MHILDKLNSRITRSRSLLCVGLDSELARLPARFQKEAQPQFAFNRWIIDQTLESAAAYKLNSAFYEAHGAVGWEAMQRTMDYLCETAPDVFTIIDAKRADIGNTSAQYAAAFFDTLGCDAVTLHPWLGGEALQSFLARPDKAAIILCHTSNPGSSELQDLTVTGADGIPLPLWRHLARQIAAKWNAQRNCMLVVGATVPDVIRDVRADTGDMVLLVPGIGAQGGDLDAVLRHGLTANSPSSDRRGLLINASRSILFADDPGREAQALQQAIEAGRQKK